MVYLPQGMWAHPTLQSRPGDADSSVKGFLSSDAHEGSYPATPLAPAVTAFVLDAGWFICGGGDVALRHLQGTLRFLRCGILKYGSVRVVGGAEVL